MQFLIVQVYLLCISSTGDLKSTPLECSLVGLHGGWGAWRMNQTTKQKAKKRHIANSDTDSENSYPASQPTKSSSSTSTKTPYVPRFLLIHSDQEETISSLSPFLVHKTIMSLTGEPKSIKTLRSGDLLIQFVTEHIKGYCLLSCLEQSDKRTYS